MNRKKSAPERGADNTDGYTHIHARYAILFGVLTVLYVIILVLLYPTNLNSFLMLINIIATAFQAGMYLGRSSK